MAVIGTASGQLMVSSRPGAQALNYAVEQSWKMIDEFLIGENQTLLGETRIRTDEGAPSSQ